MIPWLGIGKSPRKRMPRVNDFTRLGGLTTVE